MDGVLVIDKPGGMSSHAVVAAVRRAAGQRRVGHAGTLDPAATGVLVVCLGRATRLVPYLQASAKTYDARLRLGVETTTLDADGDVTVERDASAVDEALLCEALKAFVGEIQQVPPMVSAVKVGGERLYRKARRGEVVERPPRTVRIHDIVLEDFEPGPRPEAAFLVTCSPGTYIRSLAADVGARLGVGAHLAALRRLASGRFSLEASIDLDKVAELGAQGRLPEALLTPAQAVADYPSTTVEEATAQAIANGRPFAATGLDGPVAVHDRLGRLLAMTEDRDGLARPLVVFPPAGGDGPGEAEAQPTPAGGDGPAEAEAQPTPAGGDGPGEAEAQPTPAGGDGPGEAEAQPTPAGGDRNG